MTADTKALFSRRWNKVIGWTNIFVFVLLVALTTRLVAQSRKKYDPPSEVFTDEQNQQDQRLSRLEVEVDDMKQNAQEGARINIAANVEGRLSRLETTQEVNKDLLMGIAGAVALMLIETAQRRLSKGK